MISYLEGTVKNIYVDRITLLVDGIGYEILIPAYVMNEIKRTTTIDGGLGLHVSYHQTERQPKPVLVGFRSELDKEFFELFISVEDIGPMAAIRALGRPVREIARFIEEKGRQGTQTAEGYRRAKSGQDRGHTEGEGRKICIDARYRSCLQLPRRISGRKLKG